MKELLNKKTTKIGIAVIILAVAIGIISINVRSAHKQREYDRHVEAAERYLTELDYEQAIAEYTLALEIEPNAEEVLNALEQTYLDYAQSLADAGEYEKAVSVLEEGYAQTGRENLREKMEELKAIQEQIVEFPFELTDIAIMGYDLFDDYFEGVCAAYGCPVDQDLSNQTADSTIDNEYGYLRSSVIMGDVWNKTLDFYREDYDYRHSIHNSRDPIYGGCYRLLGDRLDGVRVHFGSELILSNMSYMAADLEFYGIDVPVELGSSDEDWNRIMQVQKIKEKGEQREDEFVMGTNWYFQTQWGSGRYQERMDDDHYYMELLIYSDSDGQIVVEGTRYTGLFRISRIVYKDGIEYRYEYQGHHRETN